MKTYRMTIAGLTRDLPVFPINDKISIAAFILFGDAEMTVACARDLLKKVPDFDIIITPEAKSIPLAHEMSRQSGKKYIVARKREKLYMGKPFSVEVQSITTQGTQKLFLSEYEAPLMTGKRVLIVDDVISTGASLTAVEELVKKAGGNIVGCCSVLAEGEAADRGDIIFLEPLPLLENDGETTK